MTKLTSDLNKLLVIDDEENMRHMLKVLAEHSGYQVETAADGREALTLLDRSQFDFILCDVKMPNIDGMEFLRRSQAVKGDATVIMMSAYGTIDLALDAMKAGAYDFISKPFKTDEVLLTLKKAEEREKLRRENNSLKNRLRTLEGEWNLRNMVGRSRSMQNLFSLAVKVAQYRTTVLITGESGTGKELVARGIHYASERADKPLVPVNCGGIPETLLESELFGHLKGSFTGADRNKKGLFEEAEGGTLFLDEVGELPLALQVKLLRVLQENEIRPIGATTDRKIDVRVIAATSRDLGAEIEAGNFREDLFYRLNVMPLQIPPLREHPDDIPDLCRNFIEKFNKKMGLGVTGIARDAMAELLVYPWPGNVRELENSLERAMIMADGEEIRSRDFNFISRTENSCCLEEEPLAAGTLSLKKAKAIWEKNLIQKAIEKTGGNRSKAAEILELSFPSLLDKIKKYRIKV
ncbi:MAG: sigma-54 dependent transcriptional regulator [Proteobacteria bacterium]|nr:sigma-54 dependent transcriptional regulator [Pseudomonadota bacterium]MBU1739365.1 sigma-54 dependent transcriptional regulator [Pseudomonadota bacterium]